jgi:hypothetical protein
MNVENINKSINFYESFFQNEQKLDLIDNKYPLKKNIIKKIKQKPWNGEFIFCNKLYKLQTELKKNNKYMYSTIKCEICEMKIYETEYIIKNYHWNESLLHYIMYHNYLPSVSFIEFIFGHYVSLTNNNNIIKLPSIEYQKNKNKFLKIDKNQLQILDALMLQGSKNIYLDEKNNNKYSEHSGVLKLDGNNNLDSFIIASKSTTIVEGDPEIFFPANMIEAYDHKYIFHTHPPTGGLAGRINEGVIYEFPSASDIIHFIEHAFFGIVRGSIVICPEGVYIITKKNKNKNVIVFDKKNKKKFKSEYNEIGSETQQKYIDYYTNKYKKLDKIFYTKIAKNKKFLNELNEFIKKYNIVIKYYHRIKINDRWIINDIYLKN